MATDSSRTRKEVLIVGCGIAGPTLATWLLQSTVSGACTVDWHITIVERASSSESYGQNIDIRGTGATILRKMGLNTAVRARLTNEAGARFVDTHNKIIASNAADKTGRVSTPTSDLEILRGRLAELLYRRCRAFAAESGVGGSVEFLFEESIDSVEQGDDDDDDNNNNGKVHVRFRNSGQTRDFDIVVAADGLMSPTRRMVFGKAGEMEWVHKLGAYGAFFSMPAAETDSLWRRWYHAPGRRSIMIRPSDTPDRSTVLMIVLNDDEPKFAEAAAMGARGAQQQKQLLQEAFENAGWETPRVLKEMHAAKDFYFNMIAQIKMPTYSRGRVVLLGDAGYCPSPFSGQGTTLAFNGAYHLAGALSRHPDDHRAAFATYEATMRPIVETSQKLVPGFPQILHPETAWGIKVMHRVLSAMTLVMRVLMPVRAWMSGAAPGGYAPVEDYRFGELKEWKEE